MKTKRSVEERDRIRTRNEFIFMAVVNLLILIGWILY